MEGGPLLEDWWVELSRDFVPYLNVSAGLPDAPDQELLRAMGGRAFPTFIVLDDRGQSIVPGPSYASFRPMNRSATEGALSGVQELIALRNKEIGDTPSEVRAAEIELLEALLVEGRWREDRVTEALAVEGIDVSIVDRVRALQVVRRFQAAVGDLGDEDSDARREASERAAREMFEVHGAGRPIVDTRLRYFGEYWRFVFSGALADGDLEVADTALQVFRRVYGTDGRRRNLVDRMQHELDAARGRTGAKDGAGDGEPATGSDPGDGTKDTPPPAGG